MDFLDPRKKRAHKIRLITGYILMGIAIIMATVIIVYGADGYGFNTKTGEIVENSLLFVDSKPGGAEIYLNGKDQNSNTSARLILPSGNYKMTLKKSGYNDWAQNINLEEHTVWRYVYPFLFPAQPTPTDIKTYTSTPPLLTQSPDRRRLLVQLPASSSPNITLDEYDTADLSIPTKTITLPASLFGDVPVGTLKEVEWAADNNHLLLQNVSGNKVQYLLLDRSDVTKSVNLTTLFKLGADVEVALRNKKVDRLYLLNKINHTLQLINPSNGSTEPPMIKNVVAFKVNDQNLLTYVSPKNNLSEVNIWDDGKTYHLTDIPPSTTYFLEAAKYSGTWFYAVSSNVLPHTLIFKDPISQINDPLYKKAAAYRSLNTPGSIKVKFSDNARFVEAQSGHDFDVYDFENDQLYQYSLDPSITNPLVWMDGHRLMGQVNGQVQITDFDSTNLAKLGPTQLLAGGYFSDDFNHFLTIVGQPDGTAVLKLLDMRAGADLPKNRLSG